VLRADLKHVCGSTVRVSVMVGRGGVARMPEPVAVRILRDGAGFSLLRLDKSGASVAHTWHRTLEDAKDRASLEYGIAPGEWREEGGPG
jgi:hypothetical protein